jgi:hypothetical protein
VKYECVFIAHSLWMAMLYVVDFTADRVLANHSLKRAVGYPRDQALLFSCFWFINGLVRLVRI